ncbi:hypothetical protein FNU76_22620 [Chitinimonas arctica]|uniref:Uncharacterized protein n=1 Tax=Chitinimonas arctica TaxID=2594795 RepID=A0A516SL91_9NEIS|nr:hypothetical protein [Chitinimonas arctica]QDQ28922.1 hypothetical protein FNU76_22620 [Chitinimonas arctica]
METTTTKFDPNKFPEDPFKKNNHDPGGLEVFEVSIGKISSVETPLPINTIAANPAAGTGEPGTPPDQAPANVEKMDKQEQENAVKRLKEKLDALKKQVGALTEAEKKSRNRREENKSDYHTQLQQLKKIHAQHLTVVSGLLQQEYRPIQKEDKRTTLSRPANQSPERAHWRLHPVTEKGQ